MIDSPEPIGKVAFVGSYLPRKCGIATFTYDLVSAYAEAHPGTDCPVIAMTESGRRYDYPERVWSEVREESRPAYHSAARLLNLGRPSVEVVSLQHQYGIFGGEEGEYVLSLLERLDVPVVTTLHSVLRHPTVHIYRLTRKITELSERLVVMSQRGKEFLENIYDVEPGRIDVIPHGIHGMPLRKSDRFKEGLGLEGRYVVLNFGLLSRNKCLEDAIDALPGIVSKHPEVLLLIVGETHPRVRELEGESYREELVAQAENLGVEEHLRFVDEFVPLEKLQEYISAADTYLIPYRKEEQITSGTLAYAIGSGKAVVTTPYWHAREILSDGCGVFVPFADPPAIARAINELVENPHKRRSIEWAAFQKGLSMRWAQVARLYDESFRRAIEARGSERSGSRSASWSPHGEVAPSPDHLLSQS